MEDKSWYRSTTILTTLAVAAIVVFEAYTGTVVPDGVYILGGLLGLARLRVAVGAMKQ